MIVMEPKSNLNVTTDTPYLALMSELSGACCEDFGKKLIALLRHRTVYSL